jgi:hypothetical protein
MGEFNQYWDLEIGPKEKAVGIIVPLMQCNTNAYISRHTKLKKTPNGLKLK